MSNFSTIFNMLVGTTIPSLTGFSTKTQLTNPYNLLLNDINFLLNGWGIIVGEAVNAEYQTFGTTWVEQDFGFVLTKAVRATRNNKTPLETALKELVEDAVLIRVDLLNNDQITIPSNVEKISFLNRTAIEFIDVEEFNIISTTVNFQFVIKETI